MMHSDASVFRFRLRQYLIRLDEIDAEGFLHFDVHIVFKDAHAKRIVCLCCGGDCDNIRSRLLDHLV